MTKELYDTLQKFGITCRNPTAKPSETTPTFYKLEYWIPQIDDLIVFNVHASNKEIYPFICELTVAIYQKAMDVGVQHGIAGLQEQLKSLLDIQTND